MAVPFTARPKREPQGWTAAFFCSHDLGTLADCYLASGLDRFTSKAEIDATQTDVR